MRRILLVALLVSMIFCACVEGAETVDYTSGNIPCNEDDVYALTCCDGLLYGLFESGLYRVESSGEKTLVAAAAELFPGIEALLSDDHSVYAAAAREGQVILVQLVNADGTYVNQSVLAVELESEDDVDLSQSVLRNGFLYYPIRGSQPAVIRMPLSGEVGTPVFIDNLVCFDVTEDGEILAQTRESSWPEDTVLLQTISPETGEAETWADVGKAGYAFDMAYADADTVYLMTQREIYKVQKDGELAETGIAFTQDVVDFCLLPQGLAATSGGMLKICSFNETAEEKLSLSICGLYADDEYFTAFYEAHPTWEIRPVDTDGEETEARFIRDVLTQTPDVDIYIMHDLNLLSDIKAKGYYADLSASEVIREKAGRMYAPFVKTLMDGDKIAAFPHPYYVMIAALNYNRTLFDRLQLTVPTTWEEYFDFCIDWKENYEDANRDISVNPFMHELSLVTLLEHFDDEMTRDGIPADYQSEMLGNVLRKYLRVKELYPEEDYSGTQLFYDYDLNLAQDDSFEFGALPLTFRKDAEPIYTPLEGDVWYFVVNPYGTHVQEAIECVAAARDASRNSDPYVYTEIPDLPLENVFYEEGLEMYREQLEQLEARKAGADDDPDILLEVNEKIDALTKEMQSYADNNRYWFTEEDMGPFREIVNHVYFSDFNPVKEIYANDPEFFENITEENFQGFLQAMDSKVKMSRLERE